jgi:peptidoglycan/xylan/chitin deacetylase (PgdA/CDA1 family)
VLGTAATAAPKILIRMDEYPHWRAEHSPARYDDAAFEPWREIMTAADCPHLIAIVPRIADDPMRASGASRALTEVEVARLRQLAEDGVTFALHGYDHRTRFKHPRLQTELGTLQVRAVHVLSRVLESPSASPTITIGSAPRKSSKVWFKSLKNAFCQWMPVRSRLCTSRLCSMLNPCCADS